ncbi:hypothetical protein QBC41DRAFT_382939, partial [Cercophora samala]
MSGMTTKTAGSPKPGDVFSGVSSPLSSASSFPSVSFSGRPKRQAALRATEKLTSIIEEFGAFDEEIELRSSKRSREDTSESEDWGTVAEESGTKRLRTREFSPSNAAGNEAGTGVDVEAEINAEVDPQMMDHPSSYYVASILTNMRAIVDSQAETQYEPVSNFTGNQPMQPWIEGPVADQTWFNIDAAPYPFLDSPAIVNPLLHDVAEQAGDFHFENQHNGSLVDQIPIFDMNVYPAITNAPIVDPPMFTQAPIFDPVANSAYADHITAQAANIDTSLPVAAAVDIDEEPAPVARTTGPRAPIVRLAPRAPPIARPPPRGPPPILSNFRGGLCEALPYYKSYKGSCYNLGLHAKGFLIDLEVEKGDVFNENVIISAVGGGRVREGATMVRARDAEDKAISVRAIRKAFNEGTLIAVIAGENHPLYPCKPPAAYAVLDWFHITYMWKEMIRNPDSGRVFTVWRIRFEKADPFTPSWWIPAGREETVAPVTCPVRICDVCQQESKEIFSIGWLCLNYSCNNYYRISPSQIVDLDALSYSQAFLDERQPFTGTIPSLVPELPTASSAQHGTELGLRGGFVCPRCHHACRRLYWNWLQCEVSSCEFKQAAPMSPIPQAELDAEVVAFTSKMAGRRLRNQANDALTTIWLERYAIRSPVMSLGGYTVRQFFLTDAQEKIIGCFTIFRSNEEINAKPGGPDELFRSLEVDDIGLKRNPAAVAGRKSYSCHEVSKRGRADVLLDKLEGLTRHFQQNFGARYKFGVSVQSKGFADAPAAILKALKRLDWAKNAAVSSATANLPEEYDLGDESLTNLDAHNQRFNELLALGYMESDKINYHDDGEKELGPVVSALSLGSPCAMRFRPKRQKGFDTGGFTRSGGRENHKDILEVEMRHGDMMHAVTPEGKRRFALTARFVDPEKMEEQADRDDALIKGAIPAHAAAFEYNGF